MYQLPGFYQTPHGVTMMKKCANIIELGGATTWTKNVTEALRGDNNLGRDNIFITDLTEDTLYAMTGAGPFQNIPGNSAFRDLLYIVQFVLNAVGAKVDVPAIVGYRSQPDITFEEAIDYTMSGFVNMPKLEEIGPAGHVTNYHFRSWLIDYIRQTYLLTLERPLLIDRLRGYLGHVAWKVARKHPLTAHEKTFIIRYGSPRARAGFTEAELKSGGRRPVPVGETGHPLVLRDWERFCANNLAGPYSRFGKMVSNQLLEQLTYSWGPHIGPYTFPIGEIINFGPWKELRMAEAFSLDNSVSDFLVASREKAAGVIMNRGKRSGPFGVQQPVRLARGVSVMYFVNWDMEQVQLRVDPSCTSTEVVEYYWDSKVRQRQVSSKFLMQPENLLEEIALEHTEFGDALHGPTMITDWPFLDLDSSAPLLGDKGPRQMKFKEEIHYIKDRKLESALIDMRPFYTNVGSQYVTPAFIESIDVPIHWLAREQPAAEQYIISQLNLNREQREKALDGVRRSHNYAVLTGLVDPTQLPFGKERLLRLVKALAGVA